MTPEERQEEQKYFETLRDMFSSEGWKIFIQETVEGYQNLNSLEGCKTVEDLWYRKGQMASLANLLNLEDMLNRSEEEFESEYSSEVMH